MSNNLSLFLIIVSAPIAALLVARVKNKGVSGQVWWFFMGCIFSHFAWVYLIFQPSNPSPQVSSATLYELLLEIPTVGAKTASIAESTLGNHDISELSRKQIEDLLANTAGISAKQAQAIANSLAS